MSVILRVDVDKPFLRKKSFTKRTCLFDSRGYLESCTEVMEDLNRRGLKASFFFQTYTLPKRNLARDLLSERHGFGLHAVRTKDLKDFSNDLKNGER